jgi:hypothetical protein
MARNHWTPDLYAFCCWHRQQGATYVWLGRQLGISVEQARVRVEATRSRWHRPYIAHHLVVDGRVATIRRTQLLTYAQALADGA